MDKTITYAEKLVASLLENIFNPLLYILGAVALFYFLRGIYEYIEDADESDDRREGHQHMLWGIIGLTIMVSAWGVLRFISSSVKELDDEACNNYSITETGDGYNVNSSCSSESYAESIKRKLDLK